MIDHTEPQCEARLLTGKRCRSNGQRRTTKAMREFLVCSQHHKEARNGIFRPATDGKPVTQTCGDQSA